MDHPFLDHDSPPIGVMTLDEANAAADEIARLCGMGREDLLGPSRDALHTAGRAALYKRLRAGRWSFPMIGRFVGRHHTSVMYAVDAGNTAKRKRPRGARALMGAAE